MASSGSSGPGTRIRTEPPIGPLAACTGFEPVTFSLTRSCSTVELTGHSRGKTGWPPYYPLWDDPSRGAPTSNTRHGGERSRTPTTEVQAQCAAIITTPPMQVARLELATFCLEDRHSSQLSYTCKHSMRTPGLEPRHAPSQGAALSFRPRPQSERTGIEPAYPCGLPG